jgi:2-dehydropantoate 2-reductase
VEPIFGLQAEDFLDSPDEVLKQHLNTLLSHVGKTARNSLLQDHVRGRRSEVDFLNGLIVKKGREANIPTPLNEAVFSLTQQVEKKGLKPGYSNFGMLEKLIARP